MKTFSEFLAEALQQSALDINTIKDKNQHFYFQTI